MAKKKIELSDLTPVTLTNAHPKVEDLEVSKSHAEKILNRSNTGGWSLPKDSKFSFKDGKIVGTNNGSGTGETQES